MQQNNAGINNPNYGKVGSQNAWYGKKHSDISIQKMKHPKTFEELEKRKKTKVLNSKHKVNIRGKLNINNITLIEAAELTNVLYRKIFYGLKRHDIYIVDDFEFSRVSG